MRLAFSLSLWLVALTTLVSGAHGFVQLRKERADLVTTAQQELDLVATAVRVAAEHALRDGQEPDITALLLQLEEKTPVVDVFAFRLDGSVMARSWGSEDHLPRARAVLNEPAPAGGTRHLQLPTGEFAVIAPLHRDQHEVGQLVVMLPTKALRADLAAERRAAVISVAMLVVLLFSVIWVVVHWRLDRPLTRVIAVVRRLADGDLSARSDMAGRDEVAELAREFNAMAGALQEAQRRLASEAELRLQLESDMQRVNRLVTVGELGATLAHEIGSPLQVLNGRARDLSQRSDLPADARRSAAILVEQTDRVDQIVGRLLNVARRKEPHFEDTDLVESVRVVVELLAVQARRMGVRVEMPSSHAPLVRADAQQVQQVLLNLLQNALRACSRGGVVRARVVSASFVLPMASKEQASVCVEVEDSGEGVPEVLRQKIFEPFFSAWGNGPGPGGTGLGLSVVRSIVQAHSGMVTVDTASLGTASGARFRVHFPLNSRGCEEAS